MIVPAGADHAGPIVALERLVFGTEAWSAALVAEELAAVSRVVMVFRSDNAVVGYAFVLVVGDTSDLLRIAVTPERRRRGIGETLLRDVKNRARERGARRMLLEVRADNIPAFELYAAAGFAEIGRRRGYYAGCVDAIVMELAI